MTTLLRINVESRQISFIITSTLVMCVAVYVLAKQSLSESDCNSPVNLLQMKIGQGISIDQS